MNDNDTEDAYGETNVLYTADPCIAEAALPKGVLNSPDRALLRSVLEDAIFTYLYTPAKKRRAWFYLDCVAWFKPHETPTNYDIRYDGITLDFVCEHLGMDANYVRQLLYKKAKNLKETRLKGRRGIAVHSS